MEKEVLKELATLYTEKERRYRYGSDNAAFERLYGAAADLANLLECMNGFNIEAVSSFVRVVHHYTTTNNDVDKDRIIAKMIGYDGICNVLERVQTCSESIGIWSAILEELAEELEKHC